MVTTFNNKKTAAHKNIHGTPVYIIPPPGYQPVFGLPAFQKDEKNHIQVIYQRHIYKYPYTPPIDYESQSEFENITINGVKSKMFLMGNVYNFFIEDSAFSIAAGGVFPANDLAAKAQVKEALLSMCWDENY